ncbi:DUF4037 domain-containing protein [Thermopolyspora sp. NPDC052614]|uniref:DUF4037 domain-containing protein n=1 Tax=Thermopolyspora sp. NPDC052614 TaxID=3155682 RepID=UPI00342A3BBD
MFVPGLELSRAYYTEVVRPLAGRVPHSAALIGPGSDVLDFDTVRSTDHDWGPRVLLFARPADVPALRDRVTAALPDTFAGYRTVFGSDRAPARPGVVVTDAASWFTGHLGFDPGGPITILDWLATPWQRLAEVTGGAVHHDGLGVLGPARERLRWYPPDLWRYVLSCQWHRIAQAEGFPGRCGEVGDETGSAVETARLARDLMRLCLLMRRRYPPYAKWLGSAFARLTGTAELGDDLARAIAARTWRDGEEHLCRAYRRAAALHNRLALTAPLDEAVRTYFDRPFRVIGADRFARALRDRVTDPAVRALPPYGAVDQFADGADLLTRPAACRAAAAAVLGL